MERRNFLTGALVASVAIAAPAIAIASADPVDEYWAAFHAYDEDNDASVRRYDNATDAVDYWEPPTRRDFIRKFLAMFGDVGHPAEGRLALLVRRGKRLIDGGRL